MNEQELNLKLAGLLPWEEDWGQGMEQRGKDGVSWYDLSLTNALPCEPEVAIVVTAWMGQLKYLKKTLEGYRRSGALVILAYDNPLYPWMKKTEHEILRCFPNMNHYILANSVVMKHITYDGDKRNGWFWDVRYAQGIIRNFKNIKYVYCTNGDCLWEKPEGLPEIIKILGDGDLISGQQTESTIHTAAVLYKVEAFNAIFDRMAELMAVSIIGSRSPEVMLRDAVSSLGLRAVPAPKQPLDPKDGTVDMYCCYGQSSTFREVLGFRNLFAEQETAWNNGFEPLPASYVDTYMDGIYFSGDERETLLKYYETGDRRYLLQYWDRGEDSDYNRLFYPLEAYGKEPIYGSH